MRLSVRLYAITNGLFIVFALIAGFVTSQAIEDAVVEEATSNNMSAAYSIAASIGKINSQNGPLTEIFLNSIVSENEYLQYIIVADAEEVVAASGSFDATIAISSATNDISPGIIDYHGHKMCIVHFPVSVGTNRTIYMGFLMDDAYSTVYEYRMILLTVLFSTGGIFLLLIHYFNRSVIKCFNRLIKNIKDNGKNESFKKIEPSMYDEINTLIDTYNDMLSGRIEYNRQLRQLNNDLVERNTALESIACSLYHESQTPLTTIGGYLNVLDSAVKEGDMLTAKETIHVLSNAATSLSKSYKKMGDSIREELENPAEEK